MKILLTILAVALCVAARGTDALIVVYGESRIDGCYAGEGFHPTGTAFNALGSWIPTGRVWEHRRWNENFDAKKEWGLRIEDQNGDYRIFGVARVTLERSQIIEYNIQAEDCFTDGASISIDPSVRFYKANGDLNRYEGERYPNGGIVWTGQRTKGLVIRFYGEKMSINGVEFKKKP